MTQDTSCAAPYGYWAHGPRDHLPSTKGSGHGAGCLHSVKKISLATKRMNRSADIKRITANELLLDDDEKSVFLVNRAYTHTSHVPNQGGPPQ